MKREKSLGPKGWGESGGEIGFDVAQNADHGFQVVGSTIGSFGDGAAIGQLTPYIIKTDGTGNSGGCFTAEITYSAQEATAIVTDVNDGAAPNTSSELAEPTITSFVENDSLLCGTMTSNYNLEEAIELNIYPNPSEGQFYFAAPSELNSTNVRLKIINSQGKELHLETTINLSNGVFSVSPNDSLMTGIYFIVIESEGKQFIGKVMVTNH